MCGLTTQSQIGRRILGLLGFLGVERDLRLKRIERTCPIQIVASSSLPSLAS